MNKRNQKSDGITKKEATKTTSNERKKEVVPYNQRLFLRTEEAAQMLSLSPRKLGAMKASGTIPHVKVGKCTVYRMSDLQSFADEAEATKA